MRDAFATRNDRARRREGQFLRGDKYKLERSLGIGAMGSVYAATHRNGMRVAIKILHPDLARDKQLRSRFLREGYVANRVQHPSLVRVLDDDVDDDGNTFLVMELLDGVTLHEEWEAAGRSMPLPRVGAIGDAVLDVLEAVHAQGIVHRDVKPENLFMTKDGLKLLDLGLACVIESRLTANGQMMGTPEYAAPEQAAGRVHDIDARTDLYSVGATLFALLSGHPVHESKTQMEGMIYAATRPARSLRAAWRDAPSSIVTVVDKALAFDREDRWASATEMRHALAHAGPRAKKHQAASSGCSSPEPKTSVRRPSASKLGPSGTFIGQGPLADEPAASVALPLVRPAAKGPRRGR